MLENKVVALNLKRNPYFVATCIVAGSLSVVTLAGWGLCGLADTLRPFTNAIRVLGTMCVLWLGWYWLGIAKAIANIAGRLKRENLPHIEPGGNRIVNKLVEAMNHQFDVNARSIAVLERQSKHLQIQIRLSQRQKRNTEAIIYSIRDAVIVVDEFDKVLMANEAAGKLFNFDFRDCQYKPMSRLMSGTKDDENCRTEIAAWKNEFIDFLSHSRQSKVRHTKREIQLTKDGRPRVLDCIVSCVYDHHEKVCGAVAVLHDITREKEISQMKNDFVSHVSHELKTPLASIHAYSEMLLDGEAEDEATRKEFCTVIQNQATRLNRLIEDILNISRIESGLVKVKKEPLSLTILIEEQLKMIKSYAQEKNIKIIGRKPIVFEQVNADRDMLSQVIINLLSNAIKYTRSGGTVKTETEVDEIEGIVRVSVTDTGAGIPEDELEHVFDKFYRVDANKTRAKGTGLGLNLVKQIVQNVHGGRVFVRSKASQGSTFGFELPLATADVAQVGS